MASSCIDEKTIEIPEGDKAVEMKKETGSDSSNYNKSQANGHRSNHGRERRKHSPKPIGDRRSVTVTMSKSEENKDEGSKQRDQNRFWAVCFTLLSLVGIVLIAWNKTKQQQTTSKQNTVTTFGTLWTVTEFPSIDITNPTPKTTHRLDPNAPKWRDDWRCGPMFLLSEEANVEAECDPDSAWCCCSTQ